MTKTFNPMFIESLVIIAKKKKKKVKKQQLELDMKQRMGSKLGKECNKAV